MKTLYLSLYIFAYLFKSISIFYLSIHYLLFYLFIHLSIYWNCRNMFSISKITSFSQVSGDILLFEWEAEIWSTIVIENILVSPFCNLNHTWTQNRSQEKEILGADFQGVKEILQALQIPSITQQCQKFLCLLVCCAVVWQDVCSFGHKDFSAEMSACPSSDWGLWWVVECLWAFITG
jgi:hypothetical protein